MSAGEKKGRLGEDAARLYLENKGFSFVAANLHVGHDEIDLLMRDGRTLVFVEVKLRRDDRYGSAAAFVDARKQQRIRATAMLWLEAHETALQPRFDVIEIYAPDGTGTKKPEVRHLEDAFE